MLSFIFETSINLVETFIIFAFITLYLEPKNKNYRGVICFIVAWAFGFLEICIMNHITLFESLGSYIPIAMYFIYAVICLRGNLLLKLWISIITQIIVTMVAVISNLGICFIINYNPNDMIAVFNSTRVISVIISKIVLVVVYAFALRGRNNNPIKTKLWYALIIIPLLSVVSITSIMKVAMEYTDTMAYILLGIICIIIANILTYYFYTVISREYENRLKIQLLQQQYDSAKSNIESTQIFVDQMRSVKHDIKNQLLALKGYVEANSEDDAINYINTLLNEYLPSVQSFVDTGNTAFDAVVNNKIAICHTKKIFFEIKVEKNCINSIAETDVGVLFGNLLDNAIEASEQSEKRRITLDIQNRGEYLSICVCNSIKDTVLDINENLETTKKNKELHGIGIKSIKSIVEKYDGMIQFFEENQEFCCHILLLK